MPVPREIVSSKRHARSQNFSVTRNGMSSFIFFFRKNNTLISFSIYILIFDINATIILLFSSSWQILFSLNSSIFYTINYLKKMCILRFGPSLKLDLDRENVGCI